MIALNVKAPWSVLIARGEKTIELRKRATRHRGPLVIITSQVPDRAAMREKGMTKEGIDFGHVLCIVDVVGCRPATKADAARACIAIPDEPLFAWELSGKPPLLLLPVRVKGKLTTWTIDDRAVRTTGGHSIASLRARLPNADDAELARLLREIAP